MDKDKIGDTGKTSGSSKADEEPPPYPEEPSGGGVGARAHGDTKDAEPSATGESTGATEYHDHYVTCTSTTLTIHTYYFPIGSKTIPLESIRTIKRVPMGIFTGRGRIWGTANLGVWAHLDASRPSKTECILLDIGQRVKPLITPDNVPALLDVLARHTGLEITEGEKRIF